MSNRSKPRRSRYAIEAFNMVGSDPVFAQWFLGNEFNQRLHAAEASGHSTGLQGAVIVDEILHLFAKELFERPTMGISALKRSITMGRFLCWPFLAGSQSWTGLAKFYTNNNATIVALQNHDATECNAVGKAIGLQSEQSGEIKGLAKGECLVWFAGSPSFIRARFDFIDFGSYPSAEKVQAAIASELDWVRARNRYAVYPNSSTAPIDFRRITRTAKSPTSVDASLMTDQMRFLQSVRDNPGVGLMEHYKRLQFTREKGVRVAGELKSSGLITLNSGKSRPGVGGPPPRIASLTPLGLQILESHENR